MGADDRGPGDFDRLALPAGEGVGQVDAVVDAVEVVCTMSAEAAAILSQA